MVCAAIVNQDLLIDTVVTVTIETEDGTATGIYPGCLHSNKADRNNYK